MRAKRQIIPVFVPHQGCPNNCVFCNQRRISGVSESASPDTVIRIISDADSLISQDLPAELAFYGGSFTAIPEHEQNKLLEAAQPFLARDAGGSIRISTRPDCIDAQTAKRLLNYGVKTIELGAQSMCADVLLSAKRGHTASDVINASSIVKNAGFKLILQMMTGLPGDTPDKSRYTAKCFTELEPDGVRIYPAVIVRDTELYDMWKRGEYREHTVEEAVELCAGLLEIFEEADIPVIRLGLNPTDELTGSSGECGAVAAGAYHPAFGELVRSRVYFDRASAELSGIKPGSSVILGVAGSEVSKMTGFRRCNIEALMRKYDLRSLKIVKSNVMPGKISVEILV